MKFIENAKDLKETRMSVIKKSLNMSDAVKQKNERTIWSKLKMNEIKRREGGALQITRKVKTLKWKVETWKRGFKIE